MTVGEWFPLTMVWRRLQGAPSAARVRVLGLTTARSTTLGKVGRAKNLVYGSRGHGAIRLGRMEPTRTRVPRVVSP
jgi:hypothetical protein